MDFYDEIMQSIAEENQDNGKYARLAKIAPTEKAKKILTDISHEEERHREFLREILNGKKSQSSFGIPVPHELSPEHDASGEIDNANTA